MRPGGAIDEVLRANRAYARRFRLGRLAPRPARRLAVVACMDARLAVEQALGLRPGDAHVIRNAGGIVTEDVLRSLILSHHLLGTQEVMVINHTGCGLSTFTDEELRSRLERSTGRTADIPAQFHAFSDLEENVRRQVRAVTSHPWIPSYVPVRGFVYEVETGRLREVPC